MIAALSVTIIIEGVVVLAYCIWHRKPLLSILVSGIAANIVTQAMLWVVLHIFFHYYLAALLVSEVFIWLLESLLIYFPNKKRLTITNVLFLSLVMNLLSFGAGWFLSI